MPTLDHAESPSPWPLLRATRHTAPEPSPKQSLVVRQSGPGGCNSAWSTGAARPLRRSPLLAETSTEKRREDESDDGHQLDEDVHARPRGVLERIPHGVANHRGLVR